MLYALILLSQSVKDRKLNRDQVSCAGNFLYICGKGGNYAYDNYYRWEKDECFWKCDPPIPEDERFDTG